MKKILLILLISLSLPMLGFSQNTFPKIVQDSMIVITPQQLKHTNLIFLEHKKLKSEILELNKKLSLQKQINDKLEESLVVQTNTIENYKSMESINKDMLYRKDQEIKKYKLSAKGWMIGGISVTVVGVLLLIAK